jgi:hypothetical protein
MLRLGKDLGLTLDQVMEMTTTEFMMWAAFYKLEAEETKKAMKR